MEPMAQENGLVAVVKKIVEEEDLDRILPQYVEEYEHVHVCGPGSKPHKKAKLKPSQILIKAWDGRL
jgi:hypothetical protein